MMLGSGNKVSCSFNAACGGFFMVAVFMMLCSIGVVFCGFGVMRCGSYVVFYAFLDGGSRCCGNLLFLDGSCFCTHDELNLCN